MSHAVNPGIQAARRSPGHVAMARLDALARFSADAGARTRLYLTIAHKAAALQVQAWMQEAGMPGTRIAAVGNVAGIQQELATIARQRKVGVTLTPSYAAAAAPCAPWLVEQLAAAVARRGAAPRRLPSGAGHDGLAMVALCPIGMLFTRCAGGISHHPAEAISTGDAAIAVDVLVDFPRHFAPPAAADGTGPGANRS